MGTNRIALLAFVGGLSFSALPVLAHHSTVQFDQTKVVTVSGVVKEFQYTNPHSWLIVEVMGPGGGVTTWGFEGAHPEDLLRAGILKNDLKPGTSVTVSGHPMRDGRAAASMIKVVRADGKVFSLQQKPAT